MTATIITPITASRNHYVKRLSEMINAQTVQPVEWLIDYSNEPIGAKRNSLCEQAKGDIIIHMDSDDLYAPDWVETCLHAMSHGDIVGLSEFYFYHTACKKVYEYKRQANAQMGLAGATLAYRKAVWYEQPFKEISAGEDREFITNRKLYCHGNKMGFVATIHGENTVSHKALPMMKQVNVTLPLLSLLNGQ